MVVRCAEDANARLARLADPLPLFRDLREPLLELVVHDIRDLDRAVLRQQGDEDRKDDVALHVHEYAVQKVPELEERVEQVQNFDAAHDASDQPRVLRLVARVADGDAAHHGELDHCTTVRSDTYIQA